MMKKVHCLHICHNRCFLEEISSKNKIFSNTLVDNFEEKNSGQTENRTPDNLFVRYVVCHPEST